MTEEDLVRLYQRGVTPRGANRAACPPPEDLLAVVEQNGSEAARLRTVNHAAGCTECGEELELLRVTRVVRERSRVPNVAFAIAASLLFVVGLGYYGFARRSVSDGDGTGLTRDGAGDVRLVAPADTVAGRFTALVWRPVSDAASYVVELRNEDGAVLTRGTTADTTFSVPDSARIAPNADTYWSVTARLADGTERRSATRRVHVTPP
jgi:hypothetical protein